MLYMPLPAYSVVFLHSVLSFLLGKTKFSYEHFLPSTVTYEYFKIDA